MAIDHLAQIKTGTITRANVIGIRKAYNAIELGNRRGVTAPKMTDEELTAILEALDTVRPLCVGDLHETGLKVMQNRRYKNQLPDCRLDVTQFKLVGFEPHGDPRNWKYTPEFAACDASGATLFYFVNVAWQSGGNGPQLSR